MLQRSVVRGAAWLEVVAGVIFLTIPDVPCAMLFASKPEGAGITLARWAGAALIALGIVCMPSTATGSRRGAVLGLLTFNLGVTILFAWVGVTNPVRGLLLWPITILHGLIAAALLPQLATTKAR
jgi:hypothetical protein